MILFPDGIEITDLEFKILEHYLISGDENYNAAEWWLLTALREKIANRKNEMVKEGFEKVRKVKDTIPASDDDIIDEFVKLPDYKNRIDKEKEDDKISSSKE